MGVGMFVALARSHNTVFSMTAWLLASVLPAAFVFYLFALAFYAAPEYDDFCYYSGYLHDGFMRTLMWDYFNWQGRGFLFVAIQIPVAISEGIGIKLLTAYSITLVSWMVAFVAGSAFAIVRAWPNLPVPIALF